MRGFMFNRTHRREILGTENMIAAHTPEHTLPPADDRIPRDRKIETWDERQEILKEVDPVINVLPAFPLRECSEWNPILDTVDAYQKKHNLCFRARDTRLITTHNDDK